MQTDHTRSWDPVWETVFRSQAWGQYPPEHVVRWAARRFYAAAERARVRVLDLGSGPGACSWYLAREGFDVAAIDGSPTAIDQLQTRLSGEGLTADARVGDFLSLPWPEAHFDGVVDNATLYCNRFAAIQTAIAEVRRVLKPGGSFISANFTDRSWGYGLGRMVEPGGFTDIEEGPLAGKGFALFLSRAQVDALYRDFASIAVERIGWTVADMCQQIELWVVTCQTHP